MPRLINFKKANTSAIEVKFQQHTIRKVWKKPIAVGDELRLYTGLRTKHSHRLLASSMVICRLIEHIYISTSGQVFLDGEELTGCYLRRFAEAEGFDNAMELRQFISETYQLPFIGIVIYWESYSGCI